jgi:hypothetical protein
LLSYQTLTETLLTKNRPRAIRNCHRSALYTQAQSDYISAMGSSFEQTDFVDHDYLSAQKTAGGPFATPHPASAIAARPPTRDELDAKVGETQQKLIELKRAQENLERERATLEESRRRQTEFQSGREEMMQHLTRGIGLLEEAEFNARRDAEQMAKTLADFREAASKVQSLRQDSWTVESYQTELTRALTTLENARMEWNSARLKWPVLSPSRDESEPVSKPSPAQAASLFAAQSFPQLCKLGFALTWPVLLAGLGVIGALLAVLLRR